MSKSFLPLDKFIDSALYDEQKGFYSLKHPFGKMGSFITSPHISILFSEMITLWIILFWEHLKCPKKFCLIELGAGDAEMMFKIIETSKKFPKFFNSLDFYIFEKSSYLKNIQKKKLHGMKVKWIKNLSQIKNSNCLFIGNEFLDSFAIKQFEKRNKTWFEKYVKNENGLNKIISLQTNIRKYEKKVGLISLKIKHFLNYPWNKLN